MNSQYRSQSLTAGLQPRVLQDIRKHYYTEKMGWPEPNLTPMRLFKHPC